MLNLQELAELSQIDIANTDKNKLVDINTVSVDTSLSGVERMINYLEQVKNPYCFRCGDTTVRLRFESNGSELSSRLRNYFIGLKNG
ncbi:MAG: hypothetical protein PWQ06_2547 [Anaerophaga sp.]|nr:hypothetical protein [Eubacteriaceae bacterium]MDN5292308.1 hypothetical protein [Anaerophaga sp.]